MVAVPPLSNFWYSRGYSACFWSFAMSCVAIYCSVMIERITCGVTFIWNSDSDFRTICYCILFCF